MPPGVDGIRLRPLSIGDLLDETFLVYKRQFVAFMTATGIVVVPSALLSLGAVGLTTLLAAQVDSVVGLALVATSVLLSLAVTALAGVARLLGGIVAVQISADVILGRPVDVRGAYRLALRRLGSLLLSTLLVGLATGAVACCFPVAIFLGLSWGLVIPIVTLERQEGVDALRRSWHLMRGQRLRLLACTFLIGLLVSILILIPASVFGVGLGAWIAADPQGPTSLSGSVLVQAGQIVAQALGETVFGAVAYILMTRFYYDVLVRKEAFDLEQRLALTEASLVHPIP